MDVRTYRIIQKNSMLNKLKLSNLMNCVRYVVDNQIAGDIVECGVWMGGSAAVMAHTLLQCNDIRVVHLFDSFDDICEPLPVDGERMVKEVGGVAHAQGRLQPVKGFYLRLGKPGPGDEKHVRTLLCDVVKYPPESIRIYKGWFQHTLSQFGIGINQISLLSLDCDLHVSTRLCLEFLYDKVSLGGVIVVDDYGVYDGCRLAVDSYLAEKNIAATLDKIGTTGCVRFIKKSL